MLKKICNKWRAVYKNISRKSFWVKFELHVPSWANWFVYIYLLLRKLNFIKNLSLLEQICNFRRSNVILDLGFQLTRICSNFTSHSQTTEQNHYVRYLLKYFQNVTKLIYMDTNIIFRWLVILKHFSFFHQHCPKRTISCHNNVSVKFIGMCIDVLQTDGQDNPYKCSRPVHMYICMCSSRLKRSC